MNRHFVVLLSVGLLLPPASTTLAQSGQILCEQDLKRISDLYREKQAALSEAERTEAMQMMEVARSKCQQGGPEALNTRSREATALLEKLEKAPPPSQATVPSAR